MRPPGEVRVLVVDDEPLARDFVRRTVEAVEGVRIVGECGDGEAAVAAIEAEAPDVVFLDIRMPEVDGFDVIERVGPARMPEVVFVTAHEEYTLRAFRVHALDYVVKPCEPERIRDALEHARARLGAGEAERLRERLDELVREMVGRGAGRREPPRQITVREDHRVRFVDVDAIDWLEAEDNGVRLHAGDDTPWIRVSLAGLLEHLRSRRFLRIHRSSAVNLNRVVEVRPWGYGDHLAVLSTGEKLRVSRTYKDALLALVH